MMSPAKDNPLSDVQNVLGFLLAGFGGILSFIGLRSTEVTTVLRNNSVQASLVAGLLLLAVLAAVISVAISGSTMIPLLRAFAVFVFLLAVLPMVILFIPIQEPQPRGAIIEWTVFALVCVAVAVLLWDTVPANWRIRRLSSYRRVPLQPPSYRPVPLQPPSYRAIPLQLVFIIVSVVLLASSIYGAIRLETVSQLNSDVQLGAQVTKSGNDTALSVHVTASKVRDLGYIGISVVGLPSTVELMPTCAHVHTLPNRATCSEDPCAYLHTQCQRIMGETVTPDSAGDINETLRDNLITAKFQDIHVQAVVCSSEGICQGVGHAGSRLDIHLLNLPPIQPPPSASPK